MNVNQMMPSKFIKKEDVGNGVLYEITGVEEQDAGTQENMDMKWVLLFKETDKPLILNKTNMTAVSTILGSEESEDWIGKQVVLYNDPNIQFKGKVTGGVRLRAKRTEQDKLPFEV